MGTYIVPGAPAGSAGSMLAETHFGGSGAAQLYASGADFVYPDEYVCLCDTPQMQAHESDYADVYASTEGMAGEDDLGSDLPSAKTSETGYGGSMLGAAHAASSSAATLVQSVTMGGEGNNPQFSVPMVYSHQGYKNLATPDTASAQPIGARTATTWIKEHASATKGAAVKSINTVNPEWRDDETVAVQQSVTMEMASDLAQFAVPIVYTHQGYKNVDDGEVLRTESSTDMDGTERHCHCVHKVNRPTVA